MDAFDPVSGPLAPDDGPRGWRDRWGDLRNRLLRSPRFQNWAAAFPLTRGVARRKAATLFDLCAGFVYSQVLLAAVRLELLERAAEAPRTLPEFATLLGLSPDSSRRLVSAATALGLLELRGPGRYGLGAAGATLLGNPGVLAMIRHHPMFYTDLTDPVALLRREHGRAELESYWAYATSDAPSARSEAEITAYTELMAASQPLVAEDILAAWDFRRHRRLMDVGGGSGRFLARVAAQAPALELLLFDLPAVAAQGEEALAAAGLGDRSRALGGDAFAEALPAGADAISLIRILHDHDDDAVRRLLRNVHAALPPGGTLLVGEPFATEDGSRRITDAYFEFYLLAMGSGRPRRPREIRALLEEAGFSRIRFLRTRRPMLTGLAVAEA